MMSLTRFVFAAALLAAGCLVLTGGCKKEEAKTVPLPVVIVENVIEMDFADSVTEIGKVHAYDTSVSPPMFPAS